MKKIILLLLTALLLTSAACTGNNIDSDSTATVTFFKGGKADAAVIKTERGAILVDTGLAKNGDELVESLQAMGIEKLDVLIISHFDRDHVGGAAEILSAFPVDKVYQSNCPKESEEYSAYLAALSAAGIKPVTVTNTVSFNLYGLSVTIDGPDQATYKKDASNNSSLIASVSFKGTTLLFAGDAEDDRLEEYMTRFKRPEGTVLLKLPYHGHWMEELEAFCQAVRPDIAVIPCSKSEPEEEELAQTLALLESLGAEVHLTYDGDYSLTVS